MKKRYAYGLSVLFVVFVLSYIWGLKESKKQENQPLVWLSSYTPYQDGILKSIFPGNSEEVDSDRMAIFDDEFRLVIPDYYVLTDDPDLETESYLKYFFKISEILEKGIDSIDKVEKLNMELDLMLISTDLSRSQKSFLLWSLIVKEFERVEFNAIAFGMLVDTAHPLHPIEVAGMVIDEIDSGRHDHQVVSGLIKFLSVSHRLYQDLYVGTLFKEDPDSATIIVENGDRIREYFDFLLLNPPDDKVLPQIVEIYPRISGSSKDEFLIDVLNSRSDLLSDRLQLDVRLEAALTSSSAAENNIPKLIEFASNGDFSEEVINDFNDRFFSFATRHLISDERLMEDGRSDSAFFSDSNRYALKRYYDSVYQGYSVERFIDEPVISAIQFKDWFKMDSLLKTYTKQERIDYTINYLLDAPPHQRLAIVVGLSDDDDFYEEFLANDSIRFAVSEDFSELGGGEELNYIFNYFRELDIIRELLE